MTAERWQQIEELFNAAAECRPERRAALLEESCAGDPELRSHVDALLASDDAATDFLQNPVFELTAIDSEQKAADSLVGQRIGTYQLQQKIGHGGMGAVYLAVRADEEYQKRVAIKLVKRGMDSDAILDRFRSERQILANLDHPNIAKLLDGGTSPDGLPYFVMDYVEGLPIDHYCDRHRLPIEKRLHLFRTMCSAVHYAHQNHVLHRDLKPSNILVTNDGVPKLLDFGIAKLFSAGLDAQAPETTLTVLPFLTPQYASPEQLRSEKLTPASDVYALGVLLYQLLSGHRPYCSKGATPAEMARIICEQEPEKPSSVITRVEEAPTTSAEVRLTPESVSETREGDPEKLRRRLAGDLDNIVLKALRSEPEQRYGSVDEMSEDILRHLEGQPVLARKGTLGYRSARFIKRNKAGVTAGFFALALLVLGVIGFNLLSQRGAGVNAVASIAVLPFANPDANPDNEYLGEGLTEGLISSLSQISNLKVIARSSVVRYKGKEIDPQAVGRELGVKAVLTGRISQRGDGLSVHVELTDAQDSRRLWGDQYARSLRDLLSLQQEISREIPKRLSLKLTGEEPKAAASTRTDTEAHQLYLKGRYFFESSSFEGQQRAKEYFQQAIAKDPSYALAYVGLADMFAARMADRKAAAMKALELDNSLGEAHISLGLIKFAEWDTAGAEREYRRGIELNPGYALGHHWYSHLLMPLGRVEEGMAESRRYLELDPLSSPALLHMGWSYFVMRQYDLAIDWAKKVIAIDPNHRDTHLILAEIYYHRGMFDEFVEASLKTASLSGASIEMLTPLRDAYKKSGLRGFLQEQVRQQEQSKKPNSGKLAKAYARLGDKELALKWLEQDVDKHAVDLFRYAPSVDPDFDDIQTDPRFVPLMRRVGLRP